MTSAISYEHEREKKNAFVQSMVDDMMNTTSIQELLQTTNVRPANRNATVDDIKNTGNLELAVVDCPRLLKDHAMRMFVDRPPASTTNSATHIDDKTTKQSTLTVLNLTQKSSNDMSVWTPKMELERDQLTSVVSSVILVFFYISFCFYSLSNRRLRYVRHCVSMDSGPTLLIRRRDVP